MNREEYLLVKAMEECNELAQRISKALCFGMEEIQPDEQANPGHKTNRERIVHEYNDLAATLEMAGFPLRVVDEKAMDEKIAKVRKFMTYSESLGLIAGNLDEFIKDAVQNTKALNDADGA